MSSTFGFYKVVSVKKNDSKDFPYLLDCVDPDTGEKPTISSNKECPINTRIYWEYNNKTHKMSLQVVNNKQQ